MIVHPPIPAAGPDTEAAAVLDDDPRPPAELLDINDDPEDCDACQVAHALWPRWPHGVCPYHHGINRAADQIRTKLRELLG
ncbi:hypothetical protein ABZU32_35680 [Sphaerisporangium sp. NPDC005288]|uniref:hypothetical protein n=1 Tax=Sphaerisporangium sp. NPDC005288 TaxID=3155114 RepID=UPI0033B5C185